MNKHQLLVAGRSVTVILVAATIAAGTPTRAVASGWPPFAFRDSLTVTQGGQADRLDSGAASVLANDFDFERDRLFAYLDKAPKRGEIELRLDGTFVYYHDGSKQDEDSFTYRAFDGTSFSRETRSRSVSGRIVLPTSRQFA